ncbi:MAG: hypothetical protein UR39_C0003G0020 [Candidatus Woesebacteria bacterium GW2011_GWA1_33_30]|uniref:Protein containing DUF497 n=1 Tax=Candidatus Woesebacteria bacterium GW2011_GWA2_33_28 TaxID=1618561 RepID=A0A0G0CW74_9BACT|nr:MAG: hypothetical protein UR38_C0003G0022 [Candidatus Woesebacteria bacterium GW2011_GWA2_33_28]KKP48485.1 MAG: hypothetical protein UR39_C0003G0020 [Candidatus Woesebacteria bacterium GW2011_GWA1_33_30]KKP49623.1 MAG: hypothetical protein UR40_C0004G0022 [Microgenomates group bacterium GW2011_GWC1_33_32]KKP52240.1 MAG: hypothetical protein UR44_C0003G0022 [Candidatus Woesebacteria bacterium GW2011_GWB1_33_38]KKP58075.1 MAG: hypothetical protein UR48_C0008G0008 [Microgenomates group bacteriu
MDDLFKTSLEFEWDRGNGEKNWNLHKVKNKEAEEIFKDLIAIISLDTKHLKVELRWLLLGKTKSNRKLTVAFTKRNAKIRVISARDMNKKERKLYENQ